MLRDSAVRRLTGGLDYTVSRVNNRVWEGGVR